MERKNIIITGSSGLLGDYLCRHFGAHNNVIGVYNRTENFIEGIRREKIDLLQQTTKLENLVREFKPDYFINSAGLTSVDLCEQRPNEALEQNVQIVDHIVQALEESSAKLVHISTDHLFSGLESFYTEESSARPLNVYAETKLESEKAALKRQHSLVIRTNYYGGRSLNKESFSSWIINQMRENRRIHMFEDVYFTPISIHALAQNIENLMQSHLSGVYNVSGKQRLSKLEFAEIVAEVFDLPKELIQCSRIEGANLSAKRPLDMSLSTSKITKDLPDFIEEDVRSGLEVIKEKNLV
jgi:dTDP-4-dehydrorhamnose reductase